MQPVPDPAPRPFDIDLSGHETRRRAEVLAALGESWDPVVALREEEAAERMLYGGLDADQQQVYDRLVESGVLPAGIGRRGGENPGAGRRAAD